MLRSFSDTYNAPPSYSALFPIKSQFAIVEVPPSKTTAPPKFDEQLMNSVSRISVVPLSLYRKPGVSINTAPAFFWEATLIKLQLSMIALSISFKIKAPPVSLAFKFINFEFTTSVYLSFITAAYFDVVSLKIHLSIIIDAVAQWINPFTSSILLSNVESVTITSDS